MKPRTYPHQPNKRELALAEAWGTSGCSVAEVLASYRLELARELTLRARGMRLAILAWERAGRELDNVHRAGSPPRPCPLPVELDAAEHDLGPLTVAERAWLLHGYRSELQTLCAEQELAALRARR